MTADAPPPPPPTLVAEELEKAASLVNTALRLLATGTMVDLSALEGKVRFVCEQVAAMDRAEGVGFRPPMEALIGELDRLADAIRERHTPLAAHLDSLPQAEG